MLNDKDLERYARQVIMPAIGRRARKAFAARVLVVGAGGLAHQ